MYYSLITHVLLALTIWLIARYRYKQQVPPNPLAIKRQLSYSYDHKMEEDNNRKKKNKRAKKKNKKAYQNMEILTFEEQEMDHQAKTLQTEQNEKQDSHGGVIENMRGQNQVVMVQQQMLLVEQQQKQQWLQQKQKQEWLQQKQKQQEWRQGLFRGEWIMEQLQLMGSYFVCDLVQIIPFNGVSGHYRLLLEGCKKSIVMEWKYSNLYPKEEAFLTIFKQNLNPLEQEILQNIIASVKLQKELQTNYHYLFNLATYIYQDLLMNTNLGTLEEEKPAHHHQLAAKNSLNTDNFDLTKPHHNPQEIMLKKQIYDQILDEIFYLHDLVEKPQNTSLMNIPQEPVKQNKNISRGRYESQFEQLQLIGEGGFGKVYRVKHILDGNIYAIKKAIINCDDPDHKKMLKEVNLLSKLNHPNIVRYYQSWMEETHSMQQLLEDMSFSNEEQTKINELQNLYGKWKERHEEIVFEREDSYDGSIVDNSGIVFAYDEQDKGIVFEQENEEMNVSDSSQIDYVDHHEPNSSDSSLINNLKAFPFKILYIVMECCSGINLREFIHHKFNEEDQKIQILRGLLQGLSYIHSRHIIHRDLKPANIFLTENSKVKIGDFGIATSEERSMSICLESNHSSNQGDKTEAVGTAFYRAPEQFNRDYNEKVDIYSFGIIMFELFYPFRTAMERLEVLKELTKSHQLPKDFVVKHAETDILENITVCLQQNAEERPSASKLLQSFRNKYFAQLVSCIANPKHFQFSELLAQLFQIKNEYGTFLMRRDAYKSYATSKLERIYKIHRGTHFPTLSLVPIQDFHFLNAEKLKINTRNHKYTLLTSKGNILQYSDNCLKSWLKYAKDAMRKKKTLEEQREPIKRYTFEKIIKWHPQTNKENQLEFSEKMVSAFDITYKYENLPNVFYLCQVLKVSEAIVLTLNLTQKRPPIYLSHSLVYKLLAQKYKISKDLLYNSLLSINEQDFYSLPTTKKISFLEQKNLPNNFSKKIANVVDLVFGSGLQLLQQLDVGREGQLFTLICQQMLELEKIKAQKGNKIITNEIRWRLGLPQANCCGLFWEVGIVKGLTSVEEYSPNQLFCNYHIQINLDGEVEEADVSIWCIGDYLQEEMQKLINECWKNGLKTRWYEWQMGQKQDRARHNILIKKKNGKVHIMVRHNESKEEKSCSFIPIEQFDKDVIKQLSLSAVSYNFH